jgi:SAM-dependent methyltransferase
MTQSKAWNWNEPTAPAWLIPSEESYGIAARWQQKKFRNILDFGCGLGRHTVLFAQNGFRVSAFDLSPEGVAHTKQWLESRHLEADLCQADMNKLPYPDACFDAAFAYHVISHTDSEGIRAILAELRRVLRPGGEAYLTLCAKDTWSFQQAGYPHLDANTVVKTDDGPEKGIPHFYVALSDIPGLMRGFTLLHIRHVDDCYFEGKIQNSRHYYILAQRDREAQH